MQFNFSTPVFIRHLWQLKTVIFLHQCLICTVLLKPTEGGSETVSKITFLKIKKLINSTSSSDTSIDVQLGSSETANISIFYNRNDGILKIVFILSTFLKCSKTVVGRESKTFLLQIDLSDIINCQAFPVAPSKIYLNIK